MQTLAEFAVGPVMKLLNGTLLLYDFSRSEPRDMIVQTEGAQTKSEDDRKVQRSVQTFDGYPTCTAPPASS